MSEKTILDYETVDLDKEKKELVIIDQTLLPGKTEIIHLKEAQEIWDAIYLLKVRGAPAIGVAAAMGLYILADKIEASDYDSFYEEFVKQRDYLDSSRPTAVNLHWALNRMDRLTESTIKELKENGVEYTTGHESLLEILQKEAIAIKEEDIWVCKTIGEYGLSLVKPGDGILTHCNAGPLATSRYGTALGPILLAHEQGMSLRVYADETRPLLQGARLTAYELQRAGVDVTLICDNMASLVMKNGWVDMCFVGCDRVAMNGDAANKIGTSGVAILAHHYGVPFYVLGPTSTIDPHCASGAEIPIELRDEEEIRSKFYQQRMTLPEVKCYNPAFDVTDHELIAGIITEKGIILPPYRENLAKLMAKADNK